MKKVTTTQRQIVSKTEFVLEDKDIEVVKQCLNYCVHRLRDHPECGISGMVDIKKVEKIRKEFREDDN